MERWARGAGPAGWNRQLLPRLRLSGRAGDRAIAGESLSAPARLALGDERVDAFGRVLEHHVAGHALGGERIGVHEPLFHLLVEVALAHAHHGAAVREDLAGELVHLGIELGERRDAVYQGPGERSLRVDQIASKEHFQRVLAREIPRDADSRRGAEDAALDSRKRELA